MKTPVKRAVKPQRHVLREAWARLRAWSTNAPTTTAADIFKPAKPAPGVLPVGETELAFDSAGGGLGSAEWYSWASAWRGSFAQGTEFLGYPYLSTLAQIAEYRKMVETIATEMTRKWIKFQAAGDKDKGDKIKQLEEFMIKIGAREAFKRGAAQDGFFGRGHIYIDTGDTDNLDELPMPIGNGRDRISKSKVSPKHPVIALRTVEAVWAYPTNYNSTNPLKATWYKPDIWFVMAQRVHATRFLTLIAREVPDMLKPAYSFGGLSLTQLAKETVDNWRRTRKSVGDIINAFSCFVLSTDMLAQIQVGGPEAIVERATNFTLGRDNRGLMMLNKETEELVNVSAPLSTLDQLQAQSQEHMASVASIPLVKLLGIQPAGLNASSDGEIRMFYDWIGASQESLFRVPLQTVVDFAQLSLWGEVDPEIEFVFEPLWSLDEKGMAEVDKIEAETANIRIDGGIVAPLEERRRLADDPDSPYHGLDPEDAPDLFQEEAEGLEPKGGHEQLEAEKTDRKDAA